MKIVGSSIMMEPACLISHDPFVDLWPGTGHTPKSHAAHAGGALPVTSLQTRTEPISVMAGPGDMHRSTTADPRAGTPQISLSINSSGHDMLNSQIVQKDYALQVERDPWADMVSESYLPQPVLAQTTCQEQEWQDDTMSWHDGAWP